MLNSSLKKWLLFVVKAAITIILIWFVLRKVDMADMKRHLRGHKQGSFKCNVCPSVFTNINHWDNHMNEAHPGMPKVFFFQKGMKL